MDKVQWRTSSGGKKGPFTVDAGGGTAGPHSSHAGGGGVGVPLNMQRQAQQGQMRNQVKQVPQRRQQSGHSAHSTPAASPSHRQGMQNGMSAPQYPSAPQNFPHPPPGPSRDSSIYGNGGLSSISTTPNPLTPLDNSFSSSAGRAFPATSFSNGGFSGSFGSSPFTSSANGSTTPIEPPPGWGVSPLQNSEAFNWAHLAPQLGDPNLQLSQMPAEASDMLDPQVFSSLAALLEQNPQGPNDFQQQTPQYQQQSSQHLPQMPQQFQQQSQPESFDLLAALAQVQQQNQNQQMMPQAPVGSHNSNSSSLLTKRMQQQQQQPQPQYPQPSSAAGSANGTPNTSSTPQYPSPSNHYQGNMGMADPSSLGALPTPPQAFSSSFSSMSARPAKSSSNPTTPWPLPDRQMGYSNTPVTTPGGSEYGYGSPADNAPGPSRAPLGIQPRRREAPLPPAPAFHETPSQSSSFRSSYATPHSHVQPGSSKQVSFHTPPQQEVSQTSQGLPQQDNQSANLPPLPPGFDLASLAQLGGAGLEMAIRMGIEMGMNLSQQTRSQEATPPTPLVSQVASPAIVSNAPSPLSVFATSPEKHQNRRGGRETVVHNILHDNFLASRAPLSTVASPVPLPSFPTSRRPSHGDAGDAGFPDVSSPDEMAKKDPLASQVWKVYAKDRGALPNGARMENLTWRLMHLTLKKTEEKEAREAAAAAAAAAATVKEEEVPEPALPPPPPAQERGRSKGKSRVVGFQGASASPE